MRILIFIILFLSLKTAYCAQDLKDPQLQVSDPFEPINRAVWYVNYDILDAYLLKPTTEFYVHWVPNVGRVAINNFVLNFDEPSNIVNNLIQFDIKDAADALVRFVVNSTVGVFGLIDIVKMGGIPRKRETFSNVLGHWHVPNGPYLMLPLLGPRTTRKFVGNIVDGLYFPMGLLTFGERGGLWALDSIDKRAKALPQDKLIAQSLDSYLFVKHAYIQYEAFKFHQNKTDMDKFIKARKLEKKNKATQTDIEIDNYLDEIN
ncbi:MAG: VacJ family lipoprotein [Psychromonas sp.]|nr:VacJ family lipoprotein [Psychromonas sp.]